MQLTVTVCRGCISGDAQVPPCIGLELFKTCFVKSSYPGDYENIHVFINPVNTASTDCHSTVFCIMVNPYNEVCLLHRLDSTA